MNEMERQDKQAVQEHDERTRSSTVYYPRVDIFEQDDHTVLLAICPASMKTISTSP